MEKNGMLACTKCGSQDFTFFTSPDRLEKTATLNATTKEIKEGTDTRTLGDHQVLRCRQCSSDNVVLG
jgi:hypothetical protein